MCNYTMTNSIKALICLSTLLSAISFTTFAADDKTQPASPTQQEQKADEALKKGEEQPVTTPASK